MLKGILIFLPFVWLTLHGQSRYLTEAIPYNARISTLMHSGTEIHSGLMNTDLKNRASDVYYAWYKKDSIYHTMGGYAGRLLHGPYKEFYPDKALKVLGQHHAGRKHQTWQHWDNTGILRKTTNWRKGKESGSYILYNKQGAIKEIGRKKNGLKDGIITYYHYSDSSVSKTKSKMKKGKEKRLRVVDKMHLFISRFVILQ